MRARGIIFDWGNTLVDVELDWELIRGLRRESMAEHLRAVWGLADPWPLVEEFLRLRSLHRGLALREQYERPAPAGLREALANLALAEPRRGLVEEALAAFFAPEVERIHPFPDAVETLRELRRRGILLALVSNNTWAPCIRATLRPGALAGLLDPDVHSSEVRFRKPDPAMLLLVLRRWGLGPAEVVVVGDKRDRDVLAARRLGMRSVWARMRPEHEVTEEAEACLPDAEIRTLAELLDLVRPDP